jgi:ubiquinone/menaquinone biosynthesis C-methylase UbiE
MMAWFRGSRRQRLLQRQIQQDEAYIFGKGNEEIRRLDLQHFMFRWEFGDDYSAPIRNARSILDVACGTGRWARDMARRFPRAQVVGFDNNPQQIENAIQQAFTVGDMVPNNCSLLVGDALGRFGFANASFHFVMARANSAYVPIERWPHLLNEMLRVTAPGGWIEVRDFGVVRTESIALTAMTGIFANLAAGRNLHPGVGPYIDKYLAQQPVRDIRIKRVTVRAGRRPTRAGRLLLADYLALMDRIGPLVARIGLASQDQWNQLMRQARDETAYVTTEVELTAAYARR